MPRALVVGASSGIGLAVVGRLLAAGWDVTGIARRAAPTADPRYRHVIADVRDPVAYRAALAGVTAGGPLALCVYGAGIGQALDPATFAGEADTFATNLAGAVITAEQVLPAMLAAGAGHLIGLSSQADRLVDHHAPSYAASKAGLSTYLEGLAYACRPRGVAVTNVRFGFVDTAMSSADHARPFLISAERAAVLVERCIARRPVRFTAPRRMAVLLWLFAWPRRIRTWFA